MNKKSRQLSLFNDKDVERNGLYRCFHNPPKHLLNLLRLEGVFKVKNENLKHIFSEFNH